MKKILVLVLTVFTLFTLAACADDAGSSNNEVLGVLNTITVQSTANADFTLVTSKDDVTIDWKSDNAAIAVSGSKATVTQSEADVNVKLTATGTKGDVTATKDFTVKVEKIEKVTTIAKALVASKGTTVELAHVTVLKSYASGTHFTDGTNVIYAYGTRNLTVGDNYKLVGTVDIYNNSPQIKEAEVTALEGVDVLTINPTAVTVAELNTKSSGLDFKYYSLKATYDATNTAFVDGDDSITISKWSNAASTTALALYDGFEVTVEVFLTGGYDGLELLTYVTADELAQMDITDAQKAELASKHITLPTSTLANLDLPTTGDFGATVSWTSSNAAVIATDGTITRQPADTDVTLTATVTVGTASFDRDFVVTVISAEQTVSNELFISEYYKGVSNNKYIEIYNPGTQAVDLSTYKIVQANNSKTFEESGNAYTLSLTGTIGAGECFVIYHTGSNAIIKGLVNADKSIGNGGQVMGFNGDDAIGLFNNDVLVDVIGVEAQEKITIDGINTNLVATRKAGYGANATYTISEWTGVAPVTDGNLGADGIGSHTFKLDAVSINLIVAVVKELELSI